MNCKVPGTGESSRISHWRNERGLVALLVIYGLSIFSVLALTMITDPELERKFRTAADYDLHVVLFGGRTDSEKIVARLNVPTLLRKSEKEDFGVEVQLPVPAGAILNTEFGPGSTYSVQLSSDVRVCCDTGDDACANRPADVELPVGSVNRTVVSARVSPETTIQLALATFPADTNLALDPSIVSGDRFLVKAAKELAADPTAPLQGANLMCKVEKSGMTIASGTLALQPSGSIGRPFTGKLQLKYGSATTATSPKK